MRFLWRILPTRDRSTGCCFQCNYLEFASLGCVRSGFTSPQRPPQFRGAWLPNALEKKMERGRAREERAREQARLGELP